MASIMRKSVLVAAVLLVAAAVGSSQSGKDDAKPKVLVNPAGDIHVVVDEGGSFVEFFQKRRLLVGGLLRDRTEVLRKATKPVEKEFVNYASFNDDKGQTALFGATVTIAPLKDDAKKLVDDYLARDKDRLGVRLILKRDAKEDGVFHVVGVTSRTSVGFFERKERVGKDDFSQKDLMNENAK